MATLKAYAVPATEEHAHVLAADARPESEAEFLAASGQRPIDGLLEGVRESDLSRTLVLNGRPAAMWGVRPAASESLIGGSGVGQVWVFTGRSVPRYVRTFLAACRPALEELLRLYDVLVSVVDARFVEAVRWAVWLGFEVGPEMPFGPMGLPFHVVRLRRVAT